MFVLCVIWGLVALTRSLGITQEIDVKAEASELIDEIASIITDEVIRINRRLPGVKNKDQETRFLKWSAQKTSDAINVFCALLSALSERVTDPRETRKHIIELIKLKTIDKALERVSDDSDIQPRFLKKALNNVVALSVNFISSLFTLDA